MPRPIDGAQFLSRPNKLPWPPILLLSAIVAGWLLGRYFPVIIGIAMVDHYPLGQLQRWLGWLIIAVAIAMDVWVLVIFRKHNTNIRPDRPAASLVTSGPFSRSRNPIYAGNVAIIAGLALSNGSLWYLILLPVLFFSIQELAIKREEAHMALRFGEPWRVYRATVRRWV
jgi:protein-S-isoprenylcysteine O-methyltransferase Ste14